MSSIIRREPIFWTSTTPGYNSPDRQRTYMKNGQKVTERFPQRGHLGDYEDRVRAPGDRYWRLIDHHGFEIFHTLTNAAAHLDLSSGYAQERIAKARAFGWYGPGQCPCALLATGELRPGHVVSAEVRAGSPCPPKSYSYEEPCPHSLAERAARQAQNKAIQDARELAMKSETAKGIEATNALTEKLVDAMTTAFTERTSRGSKADR